MDTIAAMQHVFIDVEAYGPPGIGRPFALGAAKFDMERKVYARFQGLISWNGVEPLTAHQGTLDWLMRQSERVLAQTRHHTGEPFSKVWSDFRQFVFQDVGQPVFWSDDWSDFAWLDIEARRHLVSPLRDLGAQYDSSAIVKAADPLQVYSEALYGELVPHIAEHDAVRGALNLLASLHTAPVVWRRNMGFGS